MKKILAISSSGGHWSQLSRLKFLLDKYDVNYACTYDVSSQVPNRKFYKVIDANLSHKIKLILLFFQVLYVLLKVRPQVVISTGAAPGYFALVIAKILFNSKTIWLDSIANGEEPSVSGKKVKRWADLWLTQWSDISEKYGMTYLGEVI